MSEVESRLTSEHSDYEALAPSISWAFGDDTASSLEWLKRAEPGCLRVAGRRGKVEAGLLEVPMGQWYQGRSVPLLGVAGVAVAPEARGQGVAQAMLAQTLRAARARGLALSMLYPSTYGLYRKVGYELAGGLWRFTLQLKSLPRSRRALNVHSLGRERAPEIEALYREVACRRSGYADRGNYVWQRVRTPAREPARCFGVFGEGGALAGYVYARAAMLRRMPIELVLSDFVTGNAAGFRSLLSFLADHLTTADRVSWYGGPADARTLGLLERGISATLEDYWMLRIIDVRAALLARGYPALDAALDLEVVDTLLPENTGTFALRVEAGQPRLGTPGGAPRVRLGVSALAPLYSGFVSPRELSLAGQLAADERALALLSALFSGPAPACVDFF